MLIPHDNNAHFISNYFSKYLYKSINLKAKVPLTSNQSQFVLELSQHLYGAELASPQRQGR